MTFTLPVGLPPEQSRPTEALETRLRAAQTAQGSARFGLTEEVREKMMREAAKDFEAVFLTEMLKHAGLGEARESFGGGAGEEAFSGILAAEQAKVMVDAGGIGLADRIFEVLMQRENHGA